MAPIRRYLRISKFSVLEVRVYLGWPSDVGWLLSERSPALPRVLDAVRPLVIPKLEEERARSLQKSKKARKPTKDRVEQDDFEVSVFLTDNPYHHHLLVKQKHLRDAATPQLQSNSSKLTGGESHAAPIDVDAPPIVREEEDDDAFQVLRSLPAVTPPSEPRRSKRRRNNTSIEDWEESEEEASGSELFVPDNPVSKKPKTADESDATATAPGDDKKKMAMETSYDGFSIYGKALYLIVTRKDASRSTVRSGGRTRGAQMMEDFISQSQMPILDADPV